VRKIAKILIVLLSLAMIVNLAACTNTGNNAGDNEDKPAGGNDVLKVAMVASGSLGDNGIFDMGNEGLEQAKKDFGIEYKVLEGKNDPSLYYDLLKTAASNFDIVFVNPGYQFDNYLEEIAGDNPGVRFVYADGTSPFDLDNIISVSYREHEGSYLAGILAAMMTTNTEVEGINDKKVLGFVGAIDTKTINNFKVGFEEGVHSIDPEIAVKSLYVGDFNDPAKGKELATSLYDQGADIIYAAASTSGDGVIALAKEKGIYCIGVDTDKSFQAPENVMGSMLKNVAISFYDVVDLSLKQETIAKNQREGLEKGWVEMYFNDYMESFIPKDVLDALESAKEGIINNTITVNEAD